MASRGRDRLADSSQAAAQLFELSLLEGIAEEHVRVGFEHTFDSKGAEKPVAEKGRCGHDDQR